VIVRDHDMITGRRLPAKLLNTLDFFAQVCLLRTMLQRFAQCFDAVGWAAGRACGL